MYNMLKENLLSGTYYTYISGLPELYQFNSCENKISVKLFLILHKLCQDSVDKTVRLITGIFFGKLHSLVDGNIGNYI